MNEIIGIDHVCGSCQNLKEKEKRFKFPGYHLLFSEHDLPINEEKKSILLHDSKYHDVIFLKAPRKLSVEIIDHRVRTAKSNGRYHVLFEGQKLPSNRFFINDKDPLIDTVCKVFETKISKFLDREFGLPIFYRESDQEEGITTIILECKNLEKSSQFWTSRFNFKPFRSSEKLHYELLELQFPISSWNVNLLLIENKKLNLVKSYINQTGWTCLSFIVTKIESFLSNVDDKVFSHIGEPYKIKIGGKELKLIFLRGPEQELFELIEI